MKQFLFLLLAALIVSCSNDTTQKNNKEDSQTPPGNVTLGQTIKENRSLVIAEVVSMEVKDKENFLLKVKILSVEDDPNYESMVVTGDEYNLKPGYYIDENKEIPDNERNAGLKKLTELNTGDQFKAEISLEYLQGWIIHRVYN